MIRVRVLLLDPSIGWEPDLHACGDIEPHPGPRFVSKNVNGIAGEGKFLDTLGRPFNWKITFARTLRRFRSAVHRYAVNIRHFRAHRRLTTQPQRVPEETLKKFETLVIFVVPDCTFRLTRAFVSAIDAAEADADAQQQPTANGRAPANIAPAPRAGAGQPGPP